MDLVSAEEGSAVEGGGGGAFMQMQLVEQQVRFPVSATSGLYLQPFHWQEGYIQQRSTAIESIESTIAELGQIFTQLAQMVAEQRETVQRIDADTQDIADNVSGAQRELLKYYASISSNRWLMLKIFGVLIVFVSVWSSSLSLPPLTVPLVPYLHSRNIAHSLAAGTVDILCILPNTLGYLIPFTLRQSSLCTSET